MIITAKHVVGFCSGRLKSVVSQLVTSSHGVCLWFRRKVFSQVAPACTAWWRHTAQTRSVLKWTRLCRWRHARSPKEPWYCCTSQPNCWHCLHSMQSRVDMKLSGVRLSVRLSVRPSVPSFGRRTPLRRVCCCEPGGQEHTTCISIDCCTAAGCQ